MEIQGIDIANLITYALNRMASSLAYKEWSDEFRTRQNKDALDVVYKELEKIDISKLTQEEAILLGFRRMDKDRDYFLIPIWIYNAIPDGTTLISIFEHRLIKGEDEIDMDTRAGILAFSIEIKEAEKVEIEYRFDETIRVDEMEEIENE